MSSFVLSLVSPVLRKMVCGNFKESVTKMIDLDDVENGRFMKLVRLACGEDGIMAESVDELLDIGALAERLQMDAIREHVENILLNQLQEGTCVKLSQGSEANGLERLHAGSYEILRDKFQRVSHQADFDRLSEETMLSLLEEDDLGVEREEEIFEALVRWMKGSEEGYRCERLLGKIRFGVIDYRYLVNDVPLALPGHEVLKNLLGETLSKKGGRELEGKWDGVVRLCEKWRVPRSWVFGSGILKQPNHVAIDLQGHLLVSDGILHQVIVFDRNGSVVRRIGSEGKAEGQFDGPTGIALDRQGHIVVSERGNHRIQVLNANGSVVRCLGSEGTAVGQLRVPYGVAIDGNGHIVVADCLNHRIQVFGSYGSGVRRFGSLGAAVGQFKSPQGVAVDGMGRIVVADSGNHRVQVFNGNGSVALCFGSEGDGPGQLKCPNGVAVDREGRFVVAESDSRRVQVFNSDGSVARVIDAAESGAGRLRCLRGVAVDGTGRIVVVEGEDGYNKARVRIL